MKAMLLAAGRGERMRPLTDRVPKPLLQAGDRALIEHLITGLVQAGITGLVVNHAHLGDQVVAHLGDGARYGARIEYSAEPPGALETGGAIVQALPILDSDPFIVVNADIWTDYPFARLPSRLDALAHLVLVPNPPHHPAGDFALDGERVRETGATRLTFSGIAVYRRALFADLKPGRFPLAPLLRKAMSGGQVVGELYGGRWMDIGTPDRLEALDRYLRGGTPERDGS